MKRYKSVDAYIEGHPEWEAILLRLREIVQDTELDEAVKWGMPTYTFDGKNVTGLGAFKSYVGLWFFNGAYLEDNHSKLINAQEGKTQAMRQWRFETLDDIDEQLIKEYISEAIQNQRDGKVFTPPKRKPLEIPEELAKALAGNSELQSCFDSLGLTRQREFAEHVGSAKREETRQKRLEKIVPMILDGIGLNDKYR